MPDHLLLFDLWTDDEVATLNQTDTPWVQCLTCHLLTTANALTNRNHGPNSTECNRYQ